MSGLRVVYKIFFNVLWYIQALHLEGATHALVAHTRKRIEQLQSLVDQFKSIASQILVRIPAISYLPCPF